VTVVVRMPAYQTLLVDRTDGITTITFNRPEKRNAMNPQLHEEMCSVLTELEADAGTRVLVITGAGQAFSAGMDMKEYFRDVEANDARRNVNRRIANEWADHQLRMFPKPTIAMVNGYCFGGAFTIVASCDFAIAADDAIFGLSEVNWGGLPAGIVSKVISSLMAYRDALYYALTAETFDGRRAAEVKLVNRSVPKDRLREEVMALARHLLTLDPAALRSTKEAFKQVVDMSYEQAYWWLMAKSNELRWRHAREGRGGEGIDKFLDKQYRPGFDSFTKGGAKPEPGPQGR
jgi:trans-feruloyl-CoA hydratase/vanillin synthase